MYYDCSHPRRDRNKTYPVVQLVGIGTILNTTLVFPIGVRWALLYNNTQWAPVSVRAYEMRQGDWFCPQLPGTQNELGHS